MLPHEALTILAVGAHPDDIELGCGGFIAKSIAHGADVHYIIFSRCERDSGLDIEKEAIVKEAMDACSVLGVKPENVTIYDFPNTRLPSFSYEIRQKLEKKQVQLLSQQRTNVVVCPSFTDPHQDHSTLAKEVLRVFRSRESILAYENLRHGSYMFKPNVFIDISEYVEKKIRALMCFKSQQRRPYFTIDIFRSLSRTRGAQVGVDYAEGYELIKMFI